jgi:outer membrane protein TolC
MRGRIPLSLALVALGGCTLPPGEFRHNIIMPEQRTIETVDPAQLPHAAIPDIPTPRTVSDPQPEEAEWQLSLDEAIRIALERARVIRILAGTTATPSGQTIYDAAITNTTIDLAQARFDPILSLANTWSGNNTPTAIRNPAIPGTSVIPNAQIDSYLSNLGLSKTNVLGGQWQVTWIENPFSFPGAVGAPLNPEKPASLAIGYTQPLLQGAGFQVNMAPIVIARLNTAQSFFQYKDSVQEMVRGVITAYWTLVQARTDAWSRNIQVQQSKEVLDREEARLKIGFGDAATVAQARTTYNQFRANKIAADAAVIRQDGALRNIMGLPPSDHRRIVPVSAPAVQRLPHNWESIVRLAEQHRPDVIELKLITEADTVRLMQAENQALPQLNATTSYQWNGLTGIMPNGLPLSTGPGQFTDWSVGINFSVPFGLRQGRAQVRQQRLLIARDQANVDQSLHGAIHDLAGTIRDLDSAYDQFVAFKLTRESAEVNVRIQNERFRTGGGPVGAPVIYLNVLQALNDWGTAVSSESQQLLNYNIALATLERQTGTILETHGLVFAEERFRAAGPLLLPSHDRDYPEALVPVGSPQRYPGTGEPSENSFNLKNPALPESKTPELLPKPNASGPAKEPK